MVANLEKEERLKEIIKHVDKFKLVDVVTVYLYFYGSLERSKYILSTAEMELLLEYIYHVENVESRKPTVEEILEILELVKDILNDKENKLYENKNNNSCFCYAVRDFYYVKDDKKQEEILDEYIKLFGKFNQYFLENYKFTINDFIQCVQNILQEYNNRINLISRVLSYRDEKGSPEELLNLIINNYSLIMHFSNTSFSQDLNQIINFNHFLEKFSYDLEKEPKDPKKFPIVKKGESYIMPSINTMMNQARIVFEEEISKDKKESASYRKNKGDYLEEEVLKVLKQMMRNADIFSSVKYSENKRGGETDILVMYDHNIIIVEIKNRKWKEKSKEGNQKFLEQDLSANILEAYDQASRTEAYIKNNPEVKFRIGDTKKTLTIKNTEKFKIFKLGITLENLRTYAVQYYNFFENLEKDMIFMNLNDLKQICNLIEYQTEFIHYLEKRIRCNKYLEKYYFYDELYLFSEYKMRNLETIINPKSNAYRIVDIGRKSLYDFRFEESFKKEILSKKMRTFMKAMMLKIENDRMPFYSNVMMTLMDIDLEGQDRLKEGILEARNKYKIIGREATFFLATEEEKELKGYIILVVVSNNKNNNKAENVEKLGSIYGACVKSKYPNYEVIILTNYTDYPAEYIDNCIYVKNVKEDISELIEKSPDLKAIQEFNFFSA